MRDPLQGITVTDSESKRKVLELLKQEQAEKLMEVEGAAVDKQQQKKKAKKRSKLKMVTKTVSSNKSKAEATATPAPMKS